MVPFTIVTSWGPTTITHKLPDPPDPAAAQWPTVLDMTPILCSWEYALHLTCSKWHLNHACLVGLISLKLQTTLRLPTLSSPFQPPHLITKHQKSVFLDAKRTPSMFLNMLRGEKTFFYC